MPFSRTVLLKREIGWEFFKDAGKPPTGPIEGFSYFHLQLSSNLNDIYQWIAHPTVNLMFVRPLPLVVALALAVILVVRHGLKAVPLAVYALTQVAALLVLAMTAETRTALQLLPFLCLGGMLAAQPDSLSVLAEPKRPGLKRAAMAPAELI